MSLPLTAFEQRVANNAAQFLWCSRTEEVAFYDALTAASPRFRYEEVGRSVQNRPLWGAYISYPDASPATLMNRQVIMIIAGQHGNEPSGREAVLQFMRDLCADQSAETVAYLSQVAFVFVATVNTDNYQTWSEGARNNANNVDLNRDHINLLQPETRAVHALAAQFNPVFALDMHDLVEGSNSFWIEVETSKNTLVSSALRSEASTICNDHIIPAIQAEGFGSKIYNNAVQANLGVHRNGSGLHHCVPILVECNGRGTNHQVRVDSARLSKITINQAVNYHKTRIGHFQSLFDSSKIGQATSARSRALAINFQNNTTLNPPPIGYRLTSAQAATASSALVALKVKRYTLGGEVYVPLGQKGAYFLPFLLDSARSSTGRVAGTPINSLPIPNVAKNGDLHSAIIRKNGTTTTAKFVPEILGI
jgi:hypothetical protein